MPISRCNSAGFRILLGLALLISSIVLLSPGSEEPDIFPHADKLYHALGFLLLGFLADAGWPDRGFIPAKYLPLLGYGLLMEWLQLYVPLRDASGLDFVADGAGLALYGLLALPLLRHREIR